MKVFEGIVISNQMERTVIVEVFRTTPHPLYKKLVKLSKKYKADTADFAQIQVGSIVKITETKPISKDKYFKVSKIITKGDGKLIPSLEEEAKKIVEKPEDKVATKSTKRVKKESK